MTARQYLSFETIIVLVVLVLACGACRNSRTLPAKTSAEYRQLVSSFYVGLAALQVGDDERADAKLKQATEIAPGEPATWADWGLLALRRRDHDAAASRLEKAKELAPDNAHIYVLLGALESNRGKQTEAIAYLRRAVELDPRDLKAKYQLAAEVERTGAESSDKETLSLVVNILESDPGNLAALLEVTRLAAKIGDKQTLERSLATLNERASTWPPEAREQFESLKAATQGTNPRDAATRVAFLQNVLLRDPEYRRDLAEIKYSQDIVGEPFTRFIKLESPSSTPSPIDEQLTFASSPLAGAPAGKWDWLGAIPLSGEGPPTNVYANRSEVRTAAGSSLVFPAGKAMIAPAANGVLALDFSYDFRTDFAFAGAGGVRLYRQDDKGAFADVTTATTLPPVVTNATYTGAWAADIEADGDLDVVLGSQTGLPTTLRNNGDDTFTVINPFIGINGLVGFAWADLDADGDPDAAIIDGANVLHILSNERQGQFRERVLPPALLPMRTLAIADINNDGTLDLIAVQADGAVIRISDKNEGRTWETAELARISDPPNRLDTSFRLFVADFDNNGGADLLLTVQRENTGIGMLWLGDEKGGLKPAPGVNVQDRITDVADLNGDGRIDLVGLTKEGEAIAAINRGSKEYHWQVIRPRAGKGAGDQRVNPFGVGGEMEVRAGLLLQKRPIGGPVIHFGLGDQASADVVRVVWPNGTMSAEFELKADQEVVAEQRLKASCPFLFAYDGKQMTFVKDAVPWGSAIGLRINTLGSAAIAATGEWYKISRDQLVPHDGYYDIRVTAELWEVYYYDYLALMPVDHPIGTEIYVDERFVIPPAKLGFTTVETPRRLTRAADDNGNDVTSILADLDGRALDNFGRGQYQGLTRDHYVEIEMGEDAPKSGPLYLIAHGSIHDTESSLNVAITQGKRWQARPLSLEVPDRDGNWIVIQPNLGFPAGRKKTVLFNLTDIFRPGAARRVRIRTNLEIYWDQIQWAAGRPDAPLKTVELTASTADLHYRGYSVIRKPREGAPEIPDYNRLSGTTQIWHDMVGYYTRFGDVSELLRGIDDRYVIVASGDEMSLRFPEQPAPPAGWIRDFIIIGDGWIKDGDYNSTFSKTVLPLPYHDKREYVTAPGRLEDEWIYRKYPDDWSRYHTRYVTPDIFRDALRTSAR